MSGEREGLVYHGTPLTPRAALNAIMPGRAACVSFFRPDDLEALLAICPQVMFRPWSVQLLDAGDARRSGMGRIRPAAMVASLLRLAGADAVSAGAVGHHAGQSRCPFPAQRWPSQRLAVWTSGRACLAHGWADREAGEAVRPLSARLPRMDRRSEERARRLRGILSQDGRGFPADGKHLASPAYAARHSRCARISVSQRGQHQPSAERTPL